MEIRVSANLITSTSAAVSVLSRLEAAVADLGDDAALRTLDAFNAMLFPFTATTRLAKNGVIEVVIAPSAVLLALLEKVEARNV